MSHRIEEIDNVLTRLKAFKADPAYADRRYAIDANIAFLEAARSLPRYFWWLATVAPKLDGSRLLELTDFPVEEWDVAMHERLIELQKRERPGLIAPLVKAVTNHIEKENRDLIIADLGAGGMEVDRQVAEWAQKTNSSHLLTIVAVDKSSVTRKIADKNLSALKDSVEIIETGELTADLLKKMRTETRKKILIVLCTNDIFTLDQSFGPNYFDLVYHSLFRHHLTAVEQEKLDEMMKIIAKKRLEFDGFRSWPVTVPHTIVGWNYPNFLNAEIFSNLRFNTKRDIIIRAQAMGNVGFYSTTGFYLFANHS